MGQSVMLMTMLGMEFGREGVHAPVRCDINKVYVYQRGASINHDRRDE
jgi:hypothetical protein